MKFSDGVRTPLITDLQRKFKLQCTVDGKKGILFKHEEPPRQSPRVAFDCSSGFVPFRKTKISNFLMERPLKPWETSIHTRTHNWKGSGDSNVSAVDARDALYLYLCKNRDSQSDITKSLPVIYHSKPRPKTVPKTQLSEPARNDSLGHRRSYTAVQRSKVDQVRTRKALIKEEYTSRLTNDKGAFFAVRQVFPTESADHTETKSQTVGTIEKGRNTAVRNKNALPRFPVRIARPMKKEKGRYRPISRTAVRTPNQEPGAVEDTKDPQSAEAYKTILQVKREQLRQQQQQRKRYASLGTPLSQFRRTNNTMVSHYDDTETRLLESVIEVNKPPSQAAPSESVRKMSGEAATQSASNN